MPKKLDTLTARVTALEKAVAAFLKSETSGSKTKRRAAKAAPKKTGREKTRRASRIKPPSIEQLVPSGMPDFVTPMDKL